jgi:hypothetical protein
LGVVNTLPSAFLDTPSALIKSDIPYYGLILDAHSYRYSGGMNKFTLKEWSYYKSLEDFIADYKKSKNKLAFVGDNVSKNNSRFGV